MGGMRFPSTPFCRLATCLLILAAFAPEIAISNPQTPDQGASNRVLVGLWDRSWGLTLALPGFSIKENDIKPDGRRYLLAENLATMMEVSVFLEDASQSRAGKSCRETMEEQVRDTPQNFALQIVGGIEKKDAKIWEADEKTFLDYTVPSITLPGTKTVALHQKNRLVCFERDNAFIDLHLSKPDFQPSDEPLFTQIVNSIEFREGIVRHSMDYLQVGSLFYLSHNYQKAIPPYARALELEQKGRQLDKKLWYVLVDNLGMAYGITGNLDKARETFAYGIQEDPDYPLFYYNMACYYGEKGDATNAAAYLQKAYQRRANMIGGETMPDPRSDDSFKKLLKDKEFRKTVDSIVDGS